MCVLLYQVLNLVRSEFGVICLSRNSLIIYLYAPGVCSVCMILVRLVVLLARVSAHSFPLIFMSRGNQCRVSELRWPSS